MPLKFTDADLATAATACQGGPDQKEQAPRPELVG